jgi:polyisoprenoid-binding protein YceI
MKWRPVFQRLCCLLLLLPLATTAQEKTSNGPCVIPDQGHFRINVGSAGLFSAFGHDHSIEAQKISGCARLDPKEITRSSIKLDFATNGIRVLDPKESAKDRAEVQKTMETEVLLVSQFPQVTFESTSVERAGESNRFRVHGNLTIRGKTQPVVILVTLARLDNGTYRANGEYKFKQSSFGIKPVKVAGGAVKVKDELEIDFELFLR